MKNQEGLYLNSTLELMLYADVNLFGESIDTTKKNTEAVQ